MDLVNPTRQDPSASKRRRGRRGPTSPLPQQPNLGVLLFVASRSMEGAILEAVGARAVYAIDTLLMPRTRLWNYRRLSLSDVTQDGGATITSREDCGMLR